MRRRDSVLLVEDELTARTLICRRLEDFGFRIHAVADGPQALSLLHKRRFDMVLLDVGLPGMDGYQVLKALRAEFSMDVLPVIMVTGRENPEDIISALDLGANDYIIKPLDFAVVVARIRTHLALRRALASLRDSEERYAIAARGANDGLWDWNLRTNKVYYSSRWKAMLGLEEASVEAGIETWMSLVHPEDVDGLREALASHLQGLTSHFEHEHRMRHRDGSYRWMLSRGVAVRTPRGKVSRMAGSQTDMTERRVYDALTALPNQTLLRDRLEQMLVRTQVHSGDRFGVVFLDIDRFSTVNDTMGHRHGDAVLVAMARRLETCMRPGDTLARFGADEFVMLWDEVPDAPGATQVALRIQEAVAPPFTINDQRFFCSVSMGIASSATGYERAEDLLRDAHTAMLRAKAQGPGMYEIFDTAMRARAETRFQLETDLHNALLRGELRVHYQPIVSLKTLRIQGFEALVRWEQPERGLVPPQAFIPLAEETGLIVPLGLWVFREACSQAARWNERWGTNLPVTIGINFSPRQFAQPELVEHLDAIMRETGVEPSSVHLEITESAIMENAARAEELLDQLKARQMRLSIDDFGTGYSSLSYLHRFPIDILKIDRSFINRMGAETGGFEIVSTIVGLGRNLGMEVIAEGIETAEQLSRLRAMQCEYGQGYYFSRPVDAEAATRLIADSLVSIQN